MSLKKRLIEKRVSGHLLRTPTRSLQNDHSATTVKPLLSGPPIKRTPSIKRTLSLVPK